MYDDYEIAFPPSLIAIEAPNDRFLRVIIQEQTGFGRSARCAPSSPLAHRVL